MQKIETSLTPTQAVLLWLKGMLDLGQERYREKLSADPSNPRVVVLKMVADAIRENLSEPWLKPDQLELAVREGQKQADMRMILVLNLHDWVRSKFGPSELYAKLLSEKVARMLEQLKYHGKCDAEILNSWEALVEQRLIEMRNLNEMVLSISAKYFEGHPLLFPADEDSLNSEIAYLEDLAACHNNFQRNWPGWREINVDAHLSSTRDHLEGLVALFVANAKTKTLIDLGEEAEARELLDSSEYRARRELERLRSSIPLQDNVTS